MRIRIVILTIGLLFQGNLFAKDYTMDLAHVKELTLAGEFTKSVLMIDSLFPNVDDDSVKLSIQLCELQIENLSKLEKYQSALTWFEKLKELTELQAQVLLNQDLKRIEVQEKYEEKAVLDSIRHSYRKEISELSILKIQLQQKKTQRQVYLISTLIFFVVGALIVLGILWWRLKKVAFKTNEQKREIDKQIALSVDQKTVLSKQNNEILESLRFAEKIQNSILPSSTDIASNLGDSFVFFEPKNEVSGDFYWLQKLNNKIFFAVADSTGHGVPGAMVSFVNHNKLNESLSACPSPQPSLILDATKKAVTTAFSNANRQLKDGMDIVLCSFDPTIRVLEFALANNPLYLVRNGELIIYKGDRQPIGFTDQSVDFKHHSLQIQEGDVIYLCSDGFQDQFGGTRDKKYKVGNFRKLLLRIQSLEMKEQKLLLEEEFQGWKMDAEQTDDVLIIGVRF